MEQKRNKWLVRVSCLTYNHSSYITDTMNGFCMQQTNFPFVCTIVDDASTDGEQIVIRNYIEEHFDLEDKSIVRNEETNDYFLTFAQHKTNKNCYFAVYILKYNHHSIKKSKQPYFSEWSDLAKYYAICEGDDYWIHPNKLQKQVEFLEAHQDYTMVCNRTQLFSVKRQKMVGENYCYLQSSDIDPTDVINRGGLFISTCSIVYRKEVRDNIPDYWKNCRVGDYPLQIACAMKGKTYYFNDIWSVYRVQNSNSWMGRQKWGRFDAGRLKVVKSMVDMFIGFATDYPGYESVISDKVACYINRNIPSWWEPKKNKVYFSNLFDDYIKEYTFKWKVDMWIQMLGIRKIKLLYLKLFQRKYSTKIKKYQ